MDDHDPDGIDHVFIDREQLMKDIFLCRKSGVGNMISCMLCILFLFIVMQLGLDMYGTMNLAIRKSRIERTYILYMETYGYLTRDRQEQLTRELSSLGVADISYAGTTLTQAGYGQEIILSVTGCLRTGMLGEFADGFSFLREGMTDFRIYQKSTAKNREG